MKIDWIIILILSVFISLEMNQEASISNNENARTEIFSDDHQTIASQRKFKSTDFAENPFTFPHPAEINNSFSNNIPFLTQKIYQFHCTWQI